MDVLTYWELYYFFIIYFLKVCLKWHVMENVVRNFSLLCPILFLLLTDLWHINHFSISSTFRSFLSGWWIISSILIKIWWCKRSKCNLKRYIRERGCKWWWGGGWGTKYWCISWFICWVEESRLENYNSIFYILYSMQQIGY